MPTYEYECPYCGHKFEAFQKITEAALSKCPKCNHKLRRLIGSGSGIIFSRKYSQRTESGSRSCYWESVASGKGAGFYATDYRKKTPTKADNKQDKACPKIKDGGQSCQSQ